MVTWSLPPLPEPLRQVRRAHSLFLGRGIYWRPATSAEATVSLLDASERPKGTQQHGCGDMYYSVANSFYNSTICNRNVEFISFCLE